MSPDVGQSISLDASVVNEGDASATGILKFFFVNAQDDEVLIEQRSIQLAHNETTVQSIVWVVSDPFARIVARVMEVDPVEYDFTDNEKDLQLNSLAVQIITTDVACVGLVPGTAEAVISGGQGPFIVQWSSGHGDPLIQVPAGSYTVTVTMLNGLSAIGAATIVDLALPATFYLDADGDGFGNPDISVYTCEPPLQYVGTGTDCDDANDSSYPGAMEVADGEDNDCDGLTDEGFSSLSVDAGDCESVYLGFEPEECIELIVNVNGGTAPYTYLWSNGSVGPATTVCPDETTIYTIVVTDNNGFSAQDVVTVQVIDVRCGNNLDKVNVCHIPPGYPENAHTICISANALDTHLDEHGDYLGVCGSVDPCLDEMEEFQVQHADEFHVNDAMELIAVGAAVESVPSGIVITPNPADTYVTLQFTGMIKNNQVRLFDAAGKLWRVYDELPEKITVSTEELENGIYYLQVLGTDQIITRAIVVVHRR